ncbi:thiamine diphosphokinase [Leuconostoc palmae]|uniref:thiamine diphosphokinase n=1 Tax=Leuconostoc palmae TaxID=501487 RepID=UPI001C7CCCA6|nr:thiamine diphosphokinase [Leuconostoc palmae]
MQVNILAGGPTDLWPDNMFDEPGIWIGADRGAWFLYQHKKPIFMAVGDFDSLISAELTVLKKYLSESAILHVQAEKNETDTELALLNAEKQNPDIIKVFGATGGRVDHLLSNLWLMADPVFESIRDKVSFIDKTNNICFANPGEHVVKKIPGTRYLGFMPLNDVKNLKIFDAKYPLVLKDNVAKMWSSNEFIDEVVHFSFDTGVILITQTVD